MKSSVALRPRSASEPEGLEVTRTPSPCVDGSQGLAWEEHSHGEVLVHMPKHSPAVSGQERNPGGSDLAALLLHRLCLVKPVRRFSLFPFEPRCLWEFDCIRKKDTCVLI